MATEASVSSASSTFRVPPAFHCLSEDRCKQPAGLCTPALSVKSFLPQFPASGSCPPRRQAETSLLHHVHHANLSPFYWNFERSHGIAFQRLYPSVTCPTAHRKSLQAEARGGGRGGRRPRRGSGEPRPNRPSEVDPLYVNGGGVICPVPVDQQPVNEYRSLLESFPFSWAHLSLTGLLLRLGTVGICAVLLIGWPVAALEVDGGADPLRLAFGAGAGGILAAAAVAIRLYLGWSYVETRLASATIEYEETGWYDGRMWMKPSPVLARDQLLQSYEVKPALQKLRLALFGLGAALVTTCVILTTLPVPESASAPAEEENPMPSLVRPYSEESARFYEPNAFEDEMEKDPLGIAASMNRPMMPDFCF